MYYFGARYYEPVISKWISADPILDSYIGGQGSGGGIFNPVNMNLYSYSHLNPIRLLDPNGMEVSDQEGAQLSNAVYSKGGTINGWSRLSEAQAGGMGVTLNDSKSGFQSALFKRNDSNEYAYAYAGTGDRQDVKNDYDQAMGKPARQYNLAADNARALNRALGSGAELSFTGHSLGGGLAALASLTTGRKAVTFNAAGLHQNTINRYHGSMSNAGLIKNLFVAGEALTTSQSMLPIPSAVGTQVPLHHSTADWIQGLGMAFSPAVAIGVAGYKHTINAVLGAGGWK